MPNFSLKGCYNSFAKGVKLCYIPKDSSRREEWIQNCKTLGGMSSHWLPSTNFTLCEFHFAAEVWETERVDGKRRLKCTAVPTIFGGLVLQIKGKNKTINQPIIRNETLITNTDSITKQVFFKQTTNDVQNDKTKPLQLNFMSDLQTGSMASEDSLNLTYKSNNFQIEDDLFEKDLDEEEKILLELKKNVEHIDEKTNIMIKYKALDKLYTRSERFRIAMKTRHIKKQREFKKITKQLQLKVKALEVKSKFIKQIVNEDQLKILNVLYKKIPRWCNSTMIKAYQLKFA